jgi:cation:H+ antiporter
MFTLLSVAISLFFLVKSANVFIDQASVFAKKLKISGFLIGFTVVAFGTSLPELISTVFSSLAGHSQLVISSLIGSNITNFCLVFGLIAIFHNFKIRKRDVDINIPLNIVAIMAFWALAIFMGFNLNWSSGISLILIFFVLFILSKEYNHIKIIKSAMTQFNPLILILSLIFLVVSGKVCIEQIISLANQLNISETILGYFLLAIGTSLPELVTAWVAVKKNDSELAVGNILGSNLFNLLFIFGISTFIRPIQLVGFKTDLIFLTGITLATYIFAITGKKYSFNKKEGLGLVLIYVLFILFQVFRD